MVEGSRINTKTSESIPPSAPTKKFKLKNQLTETTIHPHHQNPSSDPTIIPSIPPRPLIPPKLPLRPAKHSQQQLNTKSRNLFPLEDNIYTALKPESVVNKFYSENSGVEAINLPTDFIPKGFLNNESILGLQNGKIVQFFKEKRINAVVPGPQDSSNRQFYELIPFSKHSSSFLAFQDTGIIFKVTHSPLCIKVLLRDSIPLGTFCKVIKRPEIDEIWVIGLRETSILLLNQSENQVALLKRIPSHFPDALNVSFLGPEEVSVIKSDRSIQVYSVARHSHHPALIAKLPSVIGDLVKIFKISHFNAFGTIYADGKMIIWRFKKDELFEKITVPLTLFRIQSVHIPSDGIIWLGLGNGKLLLIQNNQQSISILSEAKYHQNAINRFIESEGGGTVVTIDSSGQICSWDESLTHYKQNRKYWEMEADYCSYERISVRICSWNVAAQNPFDCIESVASKWLGFPDEESDLIVICLQEIIDLNARTFIQSNSSNTEMKGVDRWIKYIQKLLPDAYKLVHSSEMVGLALIVFSLDGLKGNLSSVSEVSVKTGLGGLHGNKGALIWRTFIHDCPVSLVACHLAAGQNGISERNNDISTILRTAHLSEAALSRKDQFAFFTGNSGTKIFDHSAIFFAGDLNYRIDLDRPECLNKISSGKIRDLLDSDQLGRQIVKRELLLSHFQEQTPEFLPTYKYDRGTTDRFDSSEKARVPSWCDRILYYSKNGGELIQPKSYNSVPEATLSDHKPIYATFELKCRKIDDQLREKILRSLI